MKNTLKGNITVSRISPGDLIRIRVQDETSRIEFIEIEMAAEQLGLALTGLSHRDCVFEVRGLQNIGKCREMKTEQVPVKSKRLTPTDEEKTAALLPFEVDGWQAYRGDFGSVHRISKYDPDGTKWYNVSFVRFVSANEKGD